MKEVVTVDFETISRFFQILFPELPKNLIAGCISLAQQKPVLLFQQSLDNCLEPDSTDRSHDFSLLMAGVCLGIGSGDLLMSRGFEISEKIANAVKGPVQ